MRHTRKVLFLALLCAAGCRTAVEAVPAAPQNPLPLLEAARRIMEAARFCTLVSIDEEGRAQARIMDPTAPDARMAVTLMTNPASRKVRQIERDPRVTLIYFDSASLGYVTILGRAERIDDREEKRRRWVERWSPHIAGPDAAHLYEVVPERIEVVSVAYGVLPDGETWTPRGVDVGEPPPPGGNRRP
jgi:general stress protein 26